jgi:quercetin dioxygenase-like cupin family protein
MPSSTSKTKLDRDAVALDPKHYKVELENDRVRVVRITYDGREKSVMHQHPAGVGVFVTGGKFKFTYPDGKSEEIETKPGQFMCFSEQWEHLPEMLSDEHFEAVYVELKE